MRRTSWLIVAGALAVIAALWWWRSSRFRWAVAGDAVQNAPSDSNAADEASSSIAPDAPGTGSIEGTVRDPDGTPVGGAVVAVARVSCAGVRAGRRLRLDERPAAPIIMPPFSQRARELLGSRRVLHDRPSRNVRDHRAASEFAALSWNASDQCASIAAVLSLPARHALRASRPHARRSREPPAFPARPPGQAASGRRHRRELAREDRSDHGPDAGAL